MVNWYDLTSLAQDDLPIEVHLSIKVKMLEKELLELKNKMLEMHGKLALLGNDS